MNLIEMIKEEVDGNVLSSISQKAGTSEEQTKKGFSVAIPAVLSGILKNNDGDNSGLLSGLFVQGATDDQPDEDDSQLLNRGSSMINNLFGNEREPLTAEISNATGLDHDRSSGLLAMIVPTVTGLISKLMTKHNWNFSDVLGRIVSSKDDIFSSLPAGVRRTFGLADIDKTDLSETPEMPDMDVSSDMEPTDFPKTDTPPDERSLKSEEPLGVDKEPIEVPPAAPIPPVADEPSIDEANVTNEPLEPEARPLSQEPVTPETIARETVEKEPVDAERIPPRAAIPPEPSKSGSGILQWILIAALIILLLWWLL